jgi:hypothetical protein
MAKLILTAGQASGNVKRELQIQTIATLSSSISHECASCSTLIKQPAGSKNILKSF